ncbi:unnamed protein product [Kuraishia capsulata CBS 1993]|uniref:Uncharacterized protein n=1 Tax=Kuraishia capsulata CBS 1993 TaxID=1382522 RepID=W6MXZ0_9ASCO|nr:uncharacterized protein KUCA_T00005713001 [Kuraishia capsulata CBS 1993]CDK29720.1 unnamed protein product [Kuraishia capsulata CBS 1993]
MTTRTFFDTFKLQTTNLLGPSLGSLGILDDFESGNTDLEDINPSLLTGQVGNTRQGITESLAVFNFKTYLDSFSFDHGVKSPVADLDFAKTSKTTLEHSSPLELSASPQTANAKNQMEEELEDLSLDEIDSQVRSNIYEAWRDHERMEEDDFDMHFDSIPDGLQSQDMEDLVAFGVGFEDFSFDNMVEDEECEVVSEGQMGSSVDRYGIEQRQKILGNSQIPRPQHAYQFPSSRISKPSELQNGFQIHSDFAQSHPTSLPFARKSSAAAATLSEVTARDLNFDHDHDIHYETETGVTDSPKRVCKPLHSIISNIARPVLMHRKNTLNLIVDAENGDMDDATKYATEINSQNCEGIPIPERTNELVTIPASGEGRVRKAALIRAVLVRNQHSQGHASTSRAGFYTESEHEAYMMQHNNGTADQCNTRNGVSKVALVGDDNKENSRPMKGYLKKTPMKSKLRTKRVQWATSLEW